MDLQPVGLGSSVKETPVNSRVISNGDAGTALIQALIITYDVCKSELLVRIRERTLDVPSQVDLLHFSA